MLSNGLRSAPLEWELDAFGVVCRQRKQNKEPVHDGNSRREGQVSEIKFRSSCKSETKQVAAQTFGSAGPENWVQRRQRACASGSLDCNHEMYAHEIESELCTQPFQPSS